MENEKITQEQLAEESKILDLKQKQLNLEKKKLQQEQFIENAKIIEHIKERLLLKISSISVMPEKYLINRASDMLDKAERISGKVLDNLDKINETLKLWIDYRSNENRS